MYRVSSPLCFTKINAEAYFSKAVFCRKLKAIYSCRSKENYLRIIIHSYIGRYVSETLNDTTIEWP